jgi:hypothetical protein
VARLKKIVVDGGFKRFRRAAETSFNMCWRHGSGVVRQVGRVVALAPLGGWSGIDTHHAPDDGDLFRENC